MAYKLPQHPISYDTLLRIYKAPKLGDTVKGLVVLDALGRLTPKSPYTCGPITQLWALSSNRYLIQCGKRTILCVVHPSQEGKEHASIA